ncbi:MAG: hypothetical protein ACYCWW_16070 [Deltaproteobacteria bacterium]
MGKRILVALALASAFGAYFAWRQLFWNDERQIDSLVRSLAKDAERGDVDAMAPSVSASYRDGRGLSREQLLARLGDYLRGAAWKRVTPIRVTVTVKGAAATASARLLLAPGATRGRRSSEALRIDLGLAREGGEWRVRSAEDWEIPNGDLVLAP